MPHDIDTERELLQQAAGRLVRTVDGLSAEDLAAPSALPGWSRAHVVAHLALNAEGLTGVLVGLVSGEPTPMYTSQEARDSEIAELASAEPSELRERLLAGGAEFDEAVAGVPSEAWSASVERTPGGRTFTAAAAVGMRLREVEIHHADLDAGYGRDAWPTAFSALVLDAMTKRGPSPTPFTVRPVDLEGVWTFGEGTGPTLTGSAADLAWWLTGRGDGEGVTSDDGDLPRIEEW